jgi:hypothetical protein
MNADPFRRAFSPLNVRKSRYEDNNQDANLMSMGDKRRQKHGMFSNPRSNSIMKRKMTKSKHA